MEHQMLGFPRTRGIDGSYQASFPRPMSGDADAPPRTHGPAGALAMGHGKLRSSLEGR